MHPAPTPAELIEKIRRALDSFSRYMGDTGCACDTTRDDYLNADVALHTLEALFTASHGGAEKVFCAFLNNMTVDANALPIVTLDKPKIMAAIQAAMLARATTQETNLVPEKTPSSTDNTPPTDGLRSAEGIISTADAREHAQILIQRGMIMQANCIYALLFERDRQAEKLRVMREAMQGMLDLFEQNKTRLGLRYEQMLPVRNAKAALADKE